jgi:O6-methylguanine-DNA--protein-cysteine methyltransferase
VLPAAHAWNSLDAINSAAVTRHADGQTNSADEEAALTGHPATSTAIGKANNDNVSHDDEEE